MVYVDDSRPDLVDGFTRRTFTAMIEGVRGLAIDTGLIGAERFDAGIRDLYRHRRGRRDVPLHVLQGRGAPLSSSPCSETHAPSACSGPSTTLSPSGVSA